MHRITHHALAALIAAAMAACGGGGGGESAPPPPSGPVTLSLSASQDVTTANGKALPLNATVTGGAAVSWQLAAGPGTLSASSGASVQYLPPPGGVTTATTVTVNASAGSITQTIKLTVHPDPGPAGLTQLAEGSAGRIDGAGTRASFQGIRSVAADDSGNLIFADANSIRKMTSAGVVSTLSANGTIDPASVAAGPAGSVYFTENDFSTISIRQLKADGSIVTLLTMPYSLQQGLRLYSGGSTLYVIQPERISTLSSNGTLVPLVGEITGAAMPNPIDGSAGTARFRHIVSVARAPSGELYVIDSVLVRKVALDGSVSTIAGTLPTGNSTGFMTPQDGTGSSAHFVTPGSIAVNAQGNLMVLEAPGSGEQPRLLRTVTPAGVVTSVPMRYDTAGWLINGSTGVLYAVNSEQVSTLQANGDASLLAGRFHTYPNLVAGDLAGNFYLIDFPLTNPHLPTRTGLSLLRVTPAGTVSTFAQSAVVRTPKSMVSDRNGNLYISDVPSTGFGISSTIGGAIFKVSPQGVVTLLAGSTTAVAGQVDGAGPAARFVQPVLVGADAEGNLYANDPETIYSTGYKVRKITPAGVVTTIDAIPAGVGTVVDALGNRYTADATRGVIVRTAPNGSTSIAAGTENNQSNMFGSLPGALSGPSGLVALGPFSFGLLAGGSVIRLVVPH
ncbi:NHL repeat-containing protein [Massilia endophytica]|uniref:hypothetical protein n=1 Tax=Massilia endophytica TaxID=2899220 RepID=UPI001E3DDF19|nr:hypothetical protein [Massilia endophytica]UGQ45669.1 hypothetical protein LSQ66_18030 [Massilia endophytica]